MPTSRRRKLDALVARMQFEHGPRALTRAAQAAPAPRVARLATTFSELDALLGGGLPVGRISEVRGPATSGKVTLAAKVTASAQRDPDAVAAWVDTWRTCDPDYLSRCGVDLDRLLVVRPDTLANALALSLRLIESRALTALVIDTLTPLLQDEDPGASENQLAGALPQINTLLLDTPTAVVCLADPQSSFRSLAHAAAVRINIQREQWLMRRGDARGYEGLAEVVKNRLGPTGSARIRITINGTVRGDGF